MTSSSSEPGRPAWPRPSPAPGAASTTKCSSAACSSTRSSTSRRRWCSSRRPSCSRSAACRWSARSRSRRASKRCATTAASSEACRLQRVAEAAGPLGAAAAATARTRCWRCARRRHGGGERVQAARAVILAVGYYDQPNLLGVPGEDLPHVQHYYKEAHPYYGQRVVVVGGANSAAEAALELHRSGAKVTVVHRHQALSSSIKYWVLPDIQNRIKEGSIAARFGRHGHGGSRPGCVQIEQDGRVEDLPADAVLLLTGLPHRPRVPAPVRRADRPGQPRARATIPRRSRRTCRTCSSPAGVVVGVDSAPVFIENGRLHGEKVVSLIASRLGR